MFNAIMNFFNSVDDVMYYPILIIVLAAAFMKLQIAVDALRGKRPFWYLMAISFVVTAVLVTLLFIGVFAENAVWIVTGIALIVLAVLDAVYFILGRTKKEN